MEKKKYAQWVFKQGSNFTWYTATRYHVLRTYGCYICSFYLHGNPIGFPGTFRKLLKPTFLLMKRQKGEDEDALCLCCSVDCRPNCSCGWIRRKRKMKKKEKEKSGMAKTRMAEMTQQNPLHLIILSELAQSSLFCYSVVEYASGK